MQQTQIMTLLRTLNIMRHDNKVKIIKILLSFMEPCRHTHRLNKHDYI